MGSCSALCGTVGCALTWADTHATALVAVIAVAFTFWQIRVARGTIDFQCVRAWLSGSIHQRKPTATTLRP